MSERPRPRAPWRGTLALFAVFAISISGLYTVLAGFAWYFALLGTVTLVLGAGFTARAVSTKKWMPPLASVVTLLVLLAQFFTGNELWLRLIPVNATWERVGQLFREGTNSITVQVVPADVDTGMLYLLTLGVGALAIVADALVNQFRLPALAGIPFAALLGIPATVGPEHTDVFVFALACVAFLALLRADGPRRDTPAAIGLGALTVIGSLIVPSLLPPISDVPDNSDRVTGVLSGINPVLDLGQNLRRSIDRDILSYTARSNTGQYLRLVVLHNFTGDTWEPDPVEIDTDNKPFAVGTPAGLGAAIFTGNDTVWVRVDNLGSPWLPMPYPVSSVSGLIGDWYWDAETFTFTSPTSTARGQDYRAASILVQPTPAQLTNAGPAPESVARYLELPDAMPASIADTAATVTEGATSDYGKAVALQDYFRNGPFTYSETAPVDNGYDGTGMEMIDEFLEAKAGYCVHFASAMAIMARTLGIPSRVAVGTLPGALSEELREGRRVMNVTTGDLHAWPELYFDGIGWVRFEPTTSRGFVPEYADRETPGVPALPLPTDPAPSASPTPTSAPLPSEAPETPVGPQSDADAWFAGLWWVLAVAGVVLLVLLPALVRVGIRRVRLSRLEGGAPFAVTGWRELLATATDLGLDVGDTSTPRVAAAELGGSLEVARSLAILEREVFAPRTIARGPDRVTNTLAVLNQLRSRASRLARIRAFFLPRSLLSRVRERLS